MHTEFLNAMNASGLTCLEPIVADGELHRFATGGKGKCNSWYVLFGDAGAYGDWKSGIKEKWTLGNKNLSPEQRRIMYQKICEASRARNQEIRERQERTAIIARKQWSKCLVHGHSPYLEHKKVNGYGIRFGKQSVIIPLHDIEGKLWNLQVIYHDGKKRFLKDSRKKGCFHVIGDLTDAGMIYCCEGYATGASVYAATEKPVAVCFDAGNLEPVIASLKAKYLDIAITIAADNDQWPDDKGKIHHTGYKKAKEAAVKHGCKVILPLFSVEIIAISRSGRAS